MGAKLAAPLVSSSKPLARTSPNPIQKTLPKATMNSEIRGAEHHKNDMAGYMYKVERGNLLLVYRLHTACEHVEPPDALVAPREASAEDFLQRSRGSFPEEVSEVLVCSFKRNCVTALQNLGNTSGATGDCKRTAIRRARTGGIERERKTRFCTRTSLIVTKVFFNTICRHVCLTTHQRVRRCSRSACSSSTSRRCRISPVSTNRSLARSLAGCPITHRMLGMVFLLRTDCSVPVERLHRIASFLESE